MRVAAWRATAVAVAPGEEVWGNAERILRLGFSVGNTRITLGSLLVAVVVLVVFAVASVVLRRGLRRFARKQNQKLSQSSLYVVERLLHYALLFFGVMLALSVAGVPMSQVAVFAGALGVGIGFGLQAMFNNFISGLILLFDRSLRVGDFVELQSGVHGHVRDIRIRCTHIATNNGIDVLVPNSEFTNGRVTNWTLGEKSRRLKVNFRVALDADFDAVERAGLEAAKNVPFTRTDEGRRAPRVWLDEFGETALHCQLVVWLTDEATLRPSTVKATYNRALLDALDRHGIVIPYPQRGLRRPGEGADRSGAGRNAARLSGPVANNTNQD